GEMPEWMQDGSAPPPLTVEPVAAPPDASSMASELEVEDEAGEDGKLEENSEPEVSSNPRDDMEKTPVATQFTVEMAEESIPYSPQSDPIVGSPASIDPPAAPIVSHPLPEEAPPRRNARRLLINLRRTGNIERDKYRLKEIYDAVREPKGRDAFAIRLLDSGKTIELAFPNDGCTISDRLTTELQKHFRVDFEVVE
ncbi:MAG: hypothetical protein R6W76_19995, partial [Caldilinea sp.]